MTSFGQLGSIFGAQNQPSGQTSSFNFFNKPTNTFGSSTAQPQQAQTFQSGTGQGLFGQQTQNLQQGPQSGNIPHQTSNSNQNLGFNQSVPLNQAQQPGQHAEYGKQEKKYDFFHQKLMNNKDSDKNELYKKLVNNYNEFSKSTNIKSNLQLESLELNLDSLDQMILPDYLKFKKSLFQLVALADNDKKDIMKNSNLDIVKGQTFLSDQGINVTKFEKELNEIKNYLITNYDFNTDLNKINLSDKTLVDDKNKLHLIATTNALWAKTNDNIIYSDVKSRKKKDLNYFIKMLKYQNIELENSNYGINLNSDNIISRKFSDNPNTARNIRGSIISMSNLQSNNKFPYGIPTNELNFNNFVLNKKASVPIPGNIHETNIKSGMIDRNRLIDKSNFINFTPLKSMSLNYSNTNFNLNKMKNINEFTNFKKNIYDINQRNGLSNFKNSNKNSFTNADNFYNPKLVNFSRNELGSSTNRQFSTLDYIENLRMVNHKGFNGVYSEEGYLSQFSNYSENLKSYFYYKIKNEIIVDNQPLLITSADLENFYKSNEDNKQKNNIFPMSISLSKLVNFFDSTNDSSRKNLFSLIYSQIRCTNKSWKNSNLTVDNVLNNTIKYYENIFFKKIISNSDLPNIKNKSEADIYGLEFDIKYSSIEKFATNLLIENFSSSRTTTIGISGFQYDKFSKSDLEKMKKWTIIYLFIRAGLIKDCLIYISNILSNMNSGSFNNPSYDVKDPDLENFFILLKQVYSELDIDQGIYSKISECIKNKNMRDVEPFKFCCFNLILKINYPQNENIFLNFEDYIWFHLNLIYRKKNFIELIDSNSLNLKYLTLSDFQDFIRDHDPNIFNPNNSSEFALDYARCLFSLLMFRDGITFISESNKNIIDSVNVGFILSELNLLKNFDDEDLFKELVEFRDHQFTDCVKNQINSFVNKINDKKKLLEILLYIKLIFIDEEPQKYLDLFKNNINRFGSFLFMLNGNTLSIDIEDRKLSFKDLLSEDENKRLIEEILSQAITDVDLKPGANSNFDDLIQLAKINKSYSKLVELIIRDSIEIINSKYFKLIESSGEERSRGYQINRLAPKNILNEKYKKILDEIKIEYDKFDSNFQYNIKMLRQLENLEEALNILESQGFSKALEIFIKKVNIYPFNSEEEVKKFASTNFVNLFEIFQKFIPTAISVQFYLLICRKRELMKDFNQSNKTEYMQIENCIKNLYLLVDLIAKNNTLKNAENLKNLLEKMHEYNA